MDRAVYEGRFASDIYVIREAVTEIIGFLKMHFPRLSKTDETDSKLIFSELLYNAAIHGNKEDKNKYVAARVEIRDDTIYCAISDEGDGFDHYSITEESGGAGETDSEIDPDENLYSDHGRGVKIAIALTDNFRFNYEGNAISFTKRIK